MSQKQTQSESVVAESLSEGLAYSDELHASFIDPPSVDIDVFKEVFFTGLRNQDKDIRNKWLDLVNNAFGRINLVNSKDEVVTWVPPIIYGFVSRDTNELEQATATHRQKKEIHKNAAEAQFVQAIQNNIKIQSPPREHIEQWKYLIKLFDPSIGTKLNKPDPGKADDEDHESW